MQLKQVNIKGFRNFKNTEINFTEKSLIIGSNDIGKTNLIYALRILLDKSFSEDDIEPKDSDFYAYENTNEIIITLKFENIVEDCILSKMKGMISPNGEMYLQYHATREKDTGNKNYIIRSGFDIDALEELQERYYRKVLNLKYIGSSRDLNSFIRKERRELLIKAKEDRNNTEKDNDNKTLIKIERNIDVLNKRINQLNYINKATGHINEELQELSLHHSENKIIFDAGSYDVNSYVDNVKLAALVNGKVLELGGDGRNNQIFLAMWAAKNEINDINPLEITLYCIEEPEAHLHPHQQRKLAEYISKVLKGQVFITSHSPQIACEFSPNSIIRLFMEKFETKAANNGASIILETAFIDMGYRMSTIPAEAFFSSAVLLVEGPSEIILYKKVAKAKGIDLDKLNISILMVDGIDFEVYVKILEALKIPWILRTDNDIFKIPKKNAFRFAGIERAINIYENYISASNIIILQNKNNLRWENKEEPNKINITSAKIIVKEIEKNGIFLSQKDLEYDLLNSSLKSEIKKYWDSDDEEEMIRLMQKRKAINILELLKGLDSKLETISNDEEIIKPLIKIVEKVKMNNEIANSNN